MLNQTNVTSASPVSTCERRRRSWPLGEAQDAQRRHREGDQLLNIVLGFGAPLTAAVVWGTWAAPRSPPRLHGAARLCIESAVFAAAALALILSGAPVLAAVLVVLVVLATWLLHCSPA